MKAEIVGWAVCYVVTRNGKLFAGLKDEIIHAFFSQKDAEIICEAENKGGYIDELHTGYRVRPLYEIPNGVTLK